MVNYQILKPLHRRATSRFRVIPIKDWEEAVNRGKQIALKRAETPIEFYNELHGSNTISTES